MTHDLKRPRERQGEDRLSPVDKLILVLCVLGVILMTYLVLDYSGITLFDAHAADVIANAWSSTATIGLALALLTAAVVSLFVWFLAKKTLGSDPDEDV
jgi:H+/Cl- antiporter ClcA